MLRVNDLSVTLGGKVILNHVSFSMGDRGVLAVMGASGIGKTTLLRVLAGLLTHDSGEILSDFDKISYKFQEPRLFDWLTARENIAAALGENNEEIVNAWLCKVGLDKDGDKFPPELSGGMQQRIALARALAYGGDLLLLDEPFSAVDAETADILMSLVREYASEHAVILVTHSKDEAKALGARIFLLENADDKK